MGGGPGGYVSALRAAQLGLKTALVEREKLGGVCLNTGCIPSKTLLDTTEIFQRAMEGGKHGIISKGLSLDWTILQKRRAKVVAKLSGGVGHLLKKAGVVVIRGTATIPAPGSVVVGEERLSTRTIVLATGSTPMALPAVPFGNKRVIDSTVALELKEVPQRLAVIGGGAIGLELGSVYHRAGTKVTLFEWEDEILPTMDKELARALRKRLLKGGMQIRTGTGATGVKVGEKGAELSWRSGEEEGVVEVDYVLVAVGRKPSNGGIDLAALGVETDGRGFVLVNEEMETTTKGIYAIGDLVPGPMLAHKASEEGVVAAETISGKRARMEYDHIPTVVYTDPEFAAVGMTEKEANDKGIETRVGVFPLVASGRATALGETEGMTKVVAAREGGEILGVHLLAPHASELIGEAVMAMGFRGDAEDMGILVHAHPTLSESLKEAALAATDMGALHI